MKDYPLVLDDIMHEVLEMSENLESYIGNLFDDRMKSQIKTELNGLKDMIKRQYNADINLFLTFEEDGCTLHLQSIILKTSGNLEYVRTENGWGLKEDLSASVLVKKRLLTLLKEGAKFQMDDGTPVISIETMKTLPEAKLMIDGIIINAAQYDAKTNMVTLVPEQGEIKEENM